MKQQNFLRLAKRELGLTYPALAAELGVSARTVEKWAMDPASADHRAMPLIATRFIVRLLDQCKRERISAGDRVAAQTIDAIATQVDPGRLASSLRSFDALQRSANRMHTPAPGRSRPPYFRSFAEKNEWERNEEMRQARRIRAKVAASR